MKARVLCALLLMGACALADEAAEVQRFVKLPLQQALHRYTAITGVQVETVVGVDALLLLPAGTATTPADESARIVKELEAQNVRLYPIAANRAVATWIDPVAAAARKERAAQARARVLRELDTAPVPPPAPAPETK